MTFIGSNDYKKIQIFEHEGEQYWPISPLKDGNCGLHAFTCGLIDSIITNKLSLETGKFDAFISHIRENSIINIEIPFDNLELKIYISKFLELIPQPDLTFSQFKHFFIEHPLTRDGLVAINLVCSQGLRTIGFTNYAKEETNVKKGEHVYVNDEDERLLENGTWVGQNIIVSLARYFNIQIKVIVEEETIPNAYYNATLLPENTTPTFALLLKNKHWHYLLPKKQNLGLTTILPSSNKQRRPSRDLLKSNNTIIQEIITHYTDFAKAVLDEFSNKLRKIYASLKEILSRESEQSKEFKQATKQIKTTAKKSSERINAWRKIWNTHDQLDQHLTYLGLHELQKALIKNPLITDNSNDATEAAILQNIEIADFLSMHYANLTKPNPTRPANNLDSHLIPNRNRCGEAHDLRNAALCISV